MASDRRSKGGSPNLPYARPIRQGAPPSATPDQPPGPTYDDDTDIYDAADWLDASVFEFPDQGVPNRAENSIARDTDSLPDSFEWEDPETLDDTPYQLPWSQAPPINDNLVALSGYYPDEAEEPEPEDYGFTLDPLSADAGAPVSTPGAYYPDEEDPELEDFAFTYGPLSADAVTSQTPDPFAPDGEDDEPVEGFTADPLSDDVVDQILTDFDGFDDFEDDDSSISSDPLSADAVVVTATPLPYYPDDVEEDEFFESDVAGPVGADNAIPIRAEYPDQSEEPEDEPFGLEAGPTVDDNDVAAGLSTLPEQGDEPEDEDFGFSADPLSADAVVVQADVPLPSYPDDTEEDEFLESDATGPLAADNDQPIRAEFSDQSEEPEDEDFGLTVDPLADSIQSDQVFQQYDDQSEEPEDEDFGFTVDPLAAEQVVQEPLPFSQYDDQSEEPPDEDYGITDMQVPEDFIPPPPPPNIAQTPAGRRRLERYIARYRGEEYEFWSYEALEAFVIQCREAEKTRPRKYRKAVKISLEPEFREEIQQYMDVPKDIQKLAPSIALEQVRKIEVKLAQVRKRHNEDEELLLWM